MPPTMTENLGTRNRTIKHNHLFLVDDVQGNVPNGNESGLGFYHMDTRFLSCLEIRLNDAMPVPLLSSTEMGYLSSIVYTNGIVSARTEEGEVIEILPETLQLKRETLIFDRLYERFTLANYNAKPLRVSLSIMFDADYKDMFDIRGIASLPPGDKRELHWYPDQPQPELVFCLKDRSGRYMETRIKVKNEHAQFGSFKDLAIVRFDWLLPPREIIACELEVLPVMIEQDGDDGATSQRWAMSVPEISDMEEALVTLNHRAREWQHVTTAFVSDNEDFNEMMARNSKDIHMLITQTPEGSYVAAGIPWYVALFGRDSIITALFCLSFNPELARESLKILAHYQGTKDDPFRDEEPGKILHELRVGELARVGEIPHTPYYGSVDSTPLWLILLYEYYQWTADLGTVRELWPNALAALKWCERNIEASPNGYSFYATRCERNGILQQGWKDSHDSVTDEFGNIGVPPIALCEVQGYIYQAREHMAKLAEILGYKTLKHQLLRENHEFRRRFNRDFWMKVHDYCAMGLNYEGDPFPIISSNPGHCISTGILTEEHAQKVASRLMAPDMFNEWGIRTLSANTMAYNPMSYHNGSVWPHDNAMIARGFASLGYPQLVEQVFTGLFNASRHMFYKRLPELFCGFRRADGREGDPPVRYPVACIPQAWAAASMYSIIQSMLNMTPDAANRTLSIRSPRLPAWMNVLQVSNLKIGDARVDLEFRRTRRTVTVDVRELEGDLNIMVEIAARPTAPERQPIETMQPVMGAKAKSGQPHRV